MDQRRLLPGGPSSSEGSTVGPRVLPLLPRLDLTNLDPNSSHNSKFSGLDQENQHSTTCIPDLD